MINFVYGQSGSGKTTYVLNSLLEDTKKGIHCFLIVPDQEALQLERITLASFPSSCQLNLEILGFSRLYNRVCREYGGLSYSYITKPIRSLIMWKTVNDLCGVLQGYTNMHPDISTADTLIASVNEFKASGISADELESVARKLDSDSPLAKRLSDLSLIYAYFDKTVSEKYTDSADDIAKLRDMLNEHDFFVGSHVYIDSFSSFTAVQHQIIEQIFSSAESVTLTVPMSSDKENSISTESIKASLKKLKKSAEKAGEATEIFLGANKRAKSPCISYLAENLWSWGSVCEEAPEFDSSIVCEICDTPYAEAEAVSAHIRNLLQSGARCRDIAIIARDAEKYRGIVDVALTRSDIPCFMSQKSDLCSMPAVKFILSALKIKKYNWQKRDVIAHLKTGLCDIDPREANLFEEYVNTWNINGNGFTAATPWTMNPDGFCEEISVRGKNILECANHVKETLVSPLLKYFVMLDASDNVADMCRATFSYIEDTRLEDKLHASALKAAERNDAKKAGEFSRIYSVILRSLADIAEALEGESVDTEEFTEILRNVFEKTEIGSIPTSIDEVTFGSASLLRTANPKYTFVIGLCDGEFPATVSDGGLLSSTDRSTLSELGIELSGDTDTRSSDELMFVQRAFASPSEKLFLFTHRHSLDGTVNFPSVAFNRVEKLFPKAKPHVYKQSDLAYLIPAPRNAVSLFRTLDEGTQKQSLKKALDEKIPDFEIFSDVSADTKNCDISSESIDKATGTAIRFSPSSFEKYVRCPFNYFCSNVLKLRENANSKFNTNDMGSFIHYVLEKLIKYAIPDSPDQESPSDEELIAKTDEAVLEYVKKICPEEMIKSKRLAHLYWRLRTLSLLLIRNTVKEFSASKFRPMFFEFKVGGKDSTATPLNFKLADGASVFFTGIVDRVDVYKKDDKVYIRVVDYKTGTKTFSTDDIEHGVNLQMLIYLFTLCRTNSEQFKKSIGIESSDSALPAGVVYLSASVPYVEADDYEAKETVLEKAESQLVRSGLSLNDDDVLYAMNDTLNPSFLPKGRQNSLTSEEFDAVYDKLEETIVKIASELRAGKADAAPLDYNGSPCDYCSSKPICRKAKN